ncbi:MAG: hydroxysqualene dehydroxylase HpnE [Gammaproteobacteria bacterium]|nr:hydroxysqualene dehydroxylase HpnE [Gammaproteobacteria bacterium]
MTKHVTIVGAGWAGLTAAVELSRHGIPVTVYESARQLGGRARSVDYGNTMLDNGQHLMIGAYHQMLNTLKIIGVEEDDVFLRLSQRLKILDFKMGNIAFDLKLPKLPSPFHLLTGVITCPSLNWREKLITLLRFNRLLKNKIQQDLSVSQWLTAARLPERYVNYLLKPLCLAALTTHPDMASAKAFQNVLQQTFNGPAKNTDLLISKIDLGNVFPAAAKKYIESQGGRVLVEHRLEAIQIKNNNIASVLINGETISIDQLILAMPAQASLKLMSQLDELKPSYQQLTLLEHEPITTIYLQFEKHVSLELPMLGVVNAITEWVFERKQYGQPDMLAVVLSAHGEHLALSKQTLTEKINRELAHLIPDLPNVISSVIIREKRAAIQCSPNVDKNRPSIKTAVDNLYLCGDYVYIEEKNHSGLPSTLEGAMRCGVKCAQLVIQD